MFFKPFKTTSAGSASKLTWALSTAAISALTLSAPLVSAQTNSGQTGSTAVLKPAPSSNAAGQMASDDRDMMEDLAEASLAEIETGKLALEKSQNPQVKKFAQQMIDDHTKALKELQQVAQTKGATMPTEPDLMHKGKATALRALSGDTFDKQYVQQAGVADHKNTMELIQKVQKSGKDPALKAYAGKTLPVVQHHLQMAQAMEKQMKQ
ncbi:MAG: hypothetical protein JWP47_3145 [Polaromonas sp.]|jgi:putative membrane protein|nr:hypothetical protein [Polaromonas sp.]